MSQSHRQRWVNECMVLGWCCYRRHTTSAKLYTRMRQEIGDADNGVRAFDAPICLAAYRLGQRAARLSEELEPAKPREVPVYHMHAHARLWWIQEAARRGYITVERGERPTDTATLLAGLFDLGIPLTNIVPTDTDQIRTAHAVGRLVAMEDRRREGEPNVFGVAAKGVDHAKA
jgi:hypothetical protein